MKTPASQPPAPPADRTAAMRAAIAAAMARSKREIPHYYLSTTIDMSAALAGCAPRMGRRAMTERLLPAVLLIKAVALALREVPELNGHWVDGGFEKAPGIHIGVAISLRGGGLVAPALHDADTTDLTALDAQLQDLVARARAGVAQELRAGGPDDHDDESRRAGSRVDVRHHLSAADRAGRLRENRRAAMGRRRARSKCGRWSP